MDTFNYWDKISERKKRTLDKVTNFRQIFGQLLIPRVSRNFEGCQIQNVRVLVEEYLDLTDEAPSDATCQAYDFRPRNPFRCGSFPAPIPSASSLLVTPGAGVKSHEIL